MCRSPGCIIRLIRITRCSASREGCVCGVSGGGGKVRNAKVKSCFGGSCVPGDPVCPSDHETDPPRARLLLPPGSGADRGDVAARPLITVRTFADARVEDGHVYAVASIGCTRPGSRSQHAATRLNPTC